MTDKSETLRPHDTTPDGLLSPDSSVQIPLIGWVRQVAEVAADRAAERIIKVRSDQCNAMLNPRIKTLEDKVEGNTASIEKITISLARLIAFMLGSGMVAGGFVKMIG